MNCWATSLHGTVSLCLLFFHPPPPLFVFEEAAFSNRRSMVMLFQPSSSALAASLHLHPPWEALLSTSTLHGKGTSSDVHICAALPATYRSSWGIAQVPVAPACHYFSERKGEAATLVMSLESLDCQLSKTPLLSHGPKHSPRVSCSASDSPSAHKPVPVQMCLHGSQIISKYNPICFLTAKLTYSQNLLLVFHKIQPV